MHDPFEGVIIRIRADRDELQAKLMGMSLNQLNSRKGHVLQNRLEILEVQLSLTMRSQARFHEIQRALEEQVAAAARNRQSQEERGA